MKFSHGIIAAALLVLASAPRAGVEILGTRIIYNANKKEVSLQLSNRDNAPYLIQSWIDDGKESGESNTPFIITPPLFRLENNKDAVLRVVKTGGQFPQDRESLYWANVKYIPSVEKIDANMLYIAVKTRMKLIYRPSTLNEENAGKAGEALVWQREDRNLVVKNPTPYVISFGYIEIGGKRLSDPDFVLPFGSKTYRLPANMSGRDVQWAIINDYGKTASPNRTSL